MLKFPAIVALFVAFTSILATTVPVSAQEPLSPKLILELKNGHLKTCIPNIRRQMQAIGVTVRSDGVELYCECLGNFYFNDFTSADFDEMKLRQGLPERIQVLQKRIQEHCADTHLY